MSALWRQKPARSCGRSRLRTASLPSPTIADGRLYVAESDKNRLLALDAANGKNPVAVPSPETGPSRRRSVIDGKVIATANDANVHVIDAEYRAAGA